MLLAVAADLDHRGSGACSAPSCSSPCSSARSRSASPSASLLTPDLGLVNTALSWFGISGPDWLGNPNTALLSVALVDVWKGVGLATVIYIAGILSIPQEYYEAVDVDGGGAWRQFRNITLPLARPRRSP